VEETRELKSVEETRELKSVEETRELRVWRKPENSQKT
jgi:hypothetical protein